MRAFFSVLKDLTLFIFVRFVNVIVIVSILTLSFGGKVML